MLTNSQIYATTLTPAVSAAETYTAALPVLRYVRCCLCGILRGCLVRHVDGIEAFSETSRYKLITSQSAQITHMRRCVAVRVSEQRAETRVRGVHAANHSLRLARALETRASITLLLQSMSDVESGASDALARAFDKASLCVSCGCEISRFHLKFS
jgi:hypothetical protein